MKVEKMSSESEVKKLVLELLAEIAKREKKKAIEKDDYVNAGLAAVFEGWFKDALKSMK